MHTGKPTHTLDSINRKQDLHSWCVDGHPDENRFRENGWNPVWFTDSIDDIIKWVMAKNVANPTITQKPAGREINSTKPAADRERHEDKTPLNRGISQAPPGRTKTQGSNQSKSSWGNAQAKLQETARNLGMEPTRKDLLIALWILQTNRKRS